MALEDVLDGVRKIIHKWVNTSSAITADVNIGDTVINVASARRFQRGDEVMLKNIKKYETQLYRIRYICRNSINIILRWI